MDIQVYSQEIILEISDVPNLAFSLKADNLIELRYHFSSI